MAHYRSRMNTTLYDDGYPYIMSQPDVFENDSPVFSGIYDSQGNPLYKIKETVTMGFHK